MRYHSNGRTVDWSSRGRPRDSDRRLGDDIVMGIVLLPGERTRTQLPGADWCDNTIKGALFWQNDHSYCDDPLRARGLPSHR